ncbi:Replication initiator protein [Gammaproteobacteria bacterium]
MKQTQQIKKNANKLPENNARRLKTHQSIIHIKHKISLQQYKYWILLLQELHEKLIIEEKHDEKGFYSMSMKKFSDYIGYIPKKSDIWDDLLALKNETIVFNVLNKDGEREKYGAGFISEWKISNSCIKFKFPSFLEDVVRGLDMPKAIFSLINWEIFNHFTGKYEAIIYKLCKDYIGIGRTPRMSLKDFREYMGIEDDEYVTFRDMNKRCIGAPTAEINNSEISDITVTTEFIKEGRKVVGLYFIVVSKKQHLLPREFSEEITVFNAAKIAINPARQKKYLEIRTPEQIALCITRANDGIERAEKSGKPIINFGAFYDTAIKEGWHEEKIAEEIQRDEQLEKKRIKYETELKAKEEKLQEVSRKKQESSELFASFEKLPEDEKTEIISGIISTNSIIKKQYDARGFTSSVVRGEILRIMKERNEQNIK